MRLQIVEPGKLRNDRCLAKLRASGVWRSLYRLDQRGLHGRQERRDLPE